LFGRRRVMMIKVHIDLAPVGNSLRSPPQIAHAAGAVAYTDFAIAHRSF
jgi:hypothetical protein